MPNHYIVPAPGQQFAPVVRRVVLLARSVGERVDIDKSMPTPRLVVGDRTLAKWHESNAIRKAADTQAAEEVAARRAAEAAERASAQAPDTSAAEGNGDAAPDSVEDEPASPAAPEDGSDEEPKGDDDQADTEVGERTASRGSKSNNTEAAPAKKAASRKRKTSK